MYNIHLQYSHSSLVNPQHQNLRMSHELGTRDFIHIVGMDRFHQLRTIYDRKILDLKGTLLFLCTHICIHCILFSIDFPKYTFLHNRLRFCTCGTHLLCHTSTLVDTSWRLHRCGDWLIQPRIVQTHHCNMDH